jgi:hypothetical protein
MKMMISPLSEWKMISLKKMMTLISLMMEGYYIALAKLAVIKENMKEKEKATQKSPCPGGPLAWFSK